MLWSHHPQHWRKDITRPVIAIAWSQYPPGRMGPRNGSPMPDPFYFDQEVQPDDTTRLIPLQQRADLIGEGLDRYMNFVLLGGGIPVILPIEPRTDFIDAVLERCDGVLLSGGDDVAPSFFNEKPLSEGSIGNLPRTWMEAAVIRSAVERKLPMFGICRGFQQLSVGFGGTLIQDIHTQLPQALTHYCSNGDCYHKVTNLGFGELVQCFPKNQFVTNSWHHQATKTIGEGIVVATAPDGIVEAAEWPKYKAMGVQWHPERMVNNPVTQKMAELFVAECGKKR